MSTTTTSNSSNSNMNASAQQLQFLEKKLKLAEEKNEALKSLITSKDDENDKSY